jgi:Caspase domain
MIFICVRLHRKLAMIGFRKSHAVVIGIDEYGQGIPSLRTAVHDAARIAQVLETGYGYSVRLLNEDVSLANLRGVFDESMPVEIEAKTVSWSTSPATASRWTVTMGRRGISFRKMQMDRTRPASWQ